MIKNSVELIDVRKRFGTTPVLTGVSLAAAEGELLTVVGPSGCGKSTLLRIVAGLEAADGGIVRIGGRDVTQAAPHARDIAMVFQNYALYPHLTVRANIETPLRTRGLPLVARLPAVGRLWPGLREARLRIRGEAEAVAAQLEIAELLERRPGQLSGGQRQRVALARALVRQPRGFLLDEPLSNLDAKIRTHLRAELKALQRALGVTMVLVTHDQVEAMSLSDRIAVMFAGRLAQVGSPDDVYRRPATLQVAEFIGDLPINRLPVEPIGDGRVAALGMTLPLRIFPRVDAATLAVRPEHVRIVPADRRSGSGLAATVALVEALGSDQAWHLVPAAAPTLRLIARQRSFGAAAFGDAGRPVWVRLDPDALMLFDEAGDRVEFAFAGEGEQRSLEAVP